MTEHRPSASVEGRKLSFDSAVLLRCAGSGVLELDSQTIRDAVLLKLLILSCVITPYPADLDALATREMLDESSDGGTELTLLLQKVGPAEIGSIVDHQKPILGTTKGRRLDGTNVKEEPFTFDITASDGILGDASLLCLPCPTVFTLESATTDFPPIMFGGFLQGVFSNVAQHPMLGCGTSVTLVGGTTLVIVSLLHVAHVHGPDSDTFFTSLMFF